MRPFKPNKSLIITILAASIISCQVNEQKVATTTESSLKERTISEKMSPIRLDTSSYKTKVAKVLVVPCSNGYSYEGVTIDPFLENILKNDKRIEFVTFPYKKMKGSGYFGVFDKVHCTKILANTSADFLIMTRMIGGHILPPSEEEKPTWGYEIKILNTKTMKQFEGFKGSEFDFFEDLEKNVLSKKEELIALILKNK